MGGGRVGRIARASIGEVAEDYGVFDTPNEAAASYNWEGFRVLTSELSEDGQFGVFHVGDTPNP